jgi:protoporphyrin/coproporphyrin ferrochelatase
LPVSVGLAHSTPRIEDTLAELSKKGLSRIFAIVMAPHRSPASYDKYVRLVKKALAALGTRGLDPLQITYAPEWHTRSGFIHAIEQNVKNAYSQLASGGTKADRAELIFTIHSIPSPMASSSPYVAQSGETAKLVAERLGMPYYHVAYTSRSGKPGDSWLEPDLGDCLEQRASEGLSSCVVAPIGFLVDHMEVLFDIDIQAQARAKKVGIRMVRSETVGFHPSFIAMLSSLVEESLS